MTFYFAIRVKGLNLSLETPLVVVHYVYRKPKQLSNTNTAVYLRWRCFDKGVAKLYE